MNEDFVSAGETRAADIREEAAVAALERFFDERRESVFFSRQIEVIHESEWFHWITNRALRDLVAADVIHSEVRNLRTGGTVNLMWHRGYRYYKREATRVVALVEAYADPNIGAALGLQGEAMVLEGFARRQFLMLGRNSQQYGDRVWTQSGHDIVSWHERQRWRGFGHPAAPCRSGAPVSVTARQYALAVAAAASCPPPAPRVVDIKLDRSPPAIASTSQTNDGRSAAAERHAADRRRSWSTKVR